VVASPYWEAKVFQAEKKLQSVSITIVVQALRILTLDLLKEISR
jgi:hypothetical protein